MTSPVLWMIVVAVAVDFARHGHTALAVCAGLLALIDAVVTAFRWMGYGR